MLLPQLQSGPQLQSTQVQFGLLHLSFFTSGAQLHIDSVSIISDLYVIDGTKIEPQYRQGTA